MTILLTADLHLNDKPRDAYRYEFLEWLRGVCVDRDVTQLYVLGDLTDDKDFHSATLVNKIVHEVSLFQDKGVKLTFLTGNHDYTNPQQPFFEFLNAMPGVSWIKTPTNIPYQSGHSVWLPHTREPEKIWPKVDFDGAAFIFAHQCFDGAENEQGRQMEGTSLDLLPKKIPVIAGDIHVPQKIRQCEYVGAPYAIKFGDSFFPRVMIYDYRNGVFADINYNGPMKELLTVRDLQKLERQLPLVHEKSVIKVRIKCEDASRWLELRRDVLELGEKMQRYIHTVEPIIDKHKSTSSRKRMKVKTSSDPELLDQYSARHAVPEGTLKTGKKLLTIR